MSTGLVHDYLLVMRGAERTFAAMSACWPNAPIHTLLYDPEGTQHVFADRQVQTSYLQRLGVKQDGFRRLLPLFPRAAQHLDLSPHDVVVSSSSSFAHGVTVPEGSLHVCYCHSPFRYAWHERDRALAEAPGPLRPALARVLARHRRWDVAAAGRVDHYIANAGITKQRIADFWNRDSEVVYPPVDTARFELGDPEDFVLVVTELVPHKRVELVLEAAKRAGRPIKVVGSGPDMERLQNAYASRQAEFLGRVGDRELNALYGRALAMVVPNVEEFGIAAVEALASGTPVVASDQGGTAETVVPGESGILVPPGDVAAFTEALRYGELERFDRPAIKRSAERFSVAAFQSRLTDAVSRLAL